MHPYFRPDPSCIVISCGWRRPNMATVDIDRFLDALCCRRVLFSSQTTSRDRRPGLIFSLSSFLPSYIVVDVVVVVTWEVEKSDTNRRPMERGQNEHRSLLRRLSLRCRGLLLHLLPDCLFIRPFFRPPTGACSQLGVIWNGSNHFPLSRLVASVLLRTQATTEKTREKKWSRKRNGAKARARYRFLDAQLRYRPLPNFCSKTKKIIQFIYK